MLDTANPSGTTRAHLLGHLDGYGKGRRVYSIHSVLPTITSLQDDVPLLILDDRIGVIRRLDITELIRTTFTYLSTIEFLTGLVRAGKRQSVLRYIANAIPHRMLRTLYTAAIDALSTSGDGGKASDASTTRHDDARSEEHMLRRQNRSQLFTQPTHGNQFEDQRIVRYSNAEPNRVHTDTCSTTTGASPGSRPFSQQSPRTGTPGKTVYSTGKSAGIQSTGKMGSCCIVRARVIVLRLARDPVVVFLIVVLERVLVIELESYELMFQANIEPRAFVWRRFVFDGGVRFRALTRVRAVVDVRRR